MKSPIAMRIHARRRARQRLNVKLTRSVRGAIIAAMRNGTATPLGVGTIATRTRWLVDVCGIECVVVYDEREEEVITLWAVTEGSPSFSAQKRHRRFQRNNEGAKTRQNGRGGGC